ncbi:unnamed protein product [Spirodela intermedia]|uniref:Uncharacterized protein n=1 Tax=Spirodela intermedia TaxID=51605 RepID=A0A7I8JPB4_SPIIN|nr:unnamed protein product [Spirodela intermedia]CAA6672018.1 unnamed protein product [Spirodela intermedia]
MGRRIVSGGCHPAEWKNGDFRSWIEVGCVSGTSSSGPRSKRRLFIVSGTLSGVVSGGCHSAEQKNGNFAALRRLSLDGEELDGGGARVRDFILRSVQQEEALHRIWYALRRWRLISRRIALFLTTACSSINQR